jgi:hypothetical protein
MEFIREETTLLGVFAQPILKFHTPCVLTRRNESLSCSPQLRQLSRPARYVVPDQQDARGQVVAIRARFKRGSQSGVAGVEPVRAMPPDPGLESWGLAGCSQLDPRHPASVTKEVLTLNHAAIRQTDEL